MDDVIYNEIVATPGYELEFAVGTTYSLDVEVYMALMLAFGRLGEFTDADLQSPLRLLEGVRKTNNRIALFCNRGGMAVPHRKNILTAMFDKSVFEVANNREPLANFHPKIWIIKERNLDNQDKRQIKLLVMSRNLTKDTSLDVAVSMTAQLDGGNPQSRRKHTPLKQFLLRLGEYANSEKRKKIRRLAADIDSIGAFELEMPFVDYDFLPLHFGETLNPDLNFKESIPAERLMIVSPFIDTETISWLTSYRPKKEKVLVTRLDSLTTEIMRIFDRENAEVWAMSQLMEQNDVQPMNLHAKMYYSWQPATGGINLWLGSANATRNGFYRNSEFLLRLTYKRGRDQFQAFKDEFCGDDKQLCQRVVTLPATEPNVVDHSLSVAVRTWLIARNNLTAEVVKVGDGYDVTIAAKRFKPIDADVTIAPLQTPFNAVCLSAQQKSGTVHVVYKTDLSEFYILSVVPHNEGPEPVKMVVKIPTVGLPADRDDSIFTSLLDTRDKFLSYIEMMITDRPQELAALFEKFDKNSINTSEPACYKSKAFYESLLKIAASNPRRIDDINQIALKLNDGVVPKSFAQMCATFKKTIKRHRR